MQKCLAGKDRRAWPAAQRRRFLARLDGSGSSPSCPHMQRARPFRMSIWRLGLLVLGWYALILQALIGGQLAARAAFDPPGISALCSEGAQALHGAPGQPQHSSGACECIAHCSNISAGAPPRVAAALQVSRGYALEKPRAANALFIPSIVHTGAPPRGPPSVAAFFA